MRSRRFLRGLVLLAAISFPLAQAEEKTVDEVAAGARQSVVVVSFEGRDGKRQGLGTGFVVSADGLIATNLHVLGEGRPLAVISPDGTHHRVTSIHASDRTLDLALIRIDAKGLVPLEIGDSDQLKDGQSVVAVGNPHGLTSSVVSGVVSAKRAVEGRAMIQLAMPIEPGNSGGPLLDLHGRVQGILTMKSAITPNLGFAMPVNALKSLLKKPNPIPMDRWLAIGRLDRALWSPVFDARWRRQAGKILVDGAGSGFGGRALCLWQQNLPALPFEVAVTVRLDDEAGAAGLAFDADGGDKHYGFYPSGGQMRLTRFNGPDVYSWTILSQQHSSAYRSGEWNQLKVRIEKAKIRCFVNNELVVESTDRELAPGKVGLVKFRETRAEFKGFHVDSRIPAAASDNALLTAIDRATSLLAKGEAADYQAILALRADTALTLEALRSRAKQLEFGAKQLRDLATELHGISVLEQLKKAVEGKDADIDLIRAALLVARLDNDELDPEDYFREVAHMEKELKERFMSIKDEDGKIKALNRFFFTECGFHGSRTDYYNRSNSYLNEVIDDREGLPITLCILYMELANRAGLKMAGIGLPGHFVLRHIPAKGEGSLIDVFDGGNQLTHDQAADRVRLATGRPSREADFSPIGKRAIIVRMLHNLMGSTQEGNDMKAALRYLDAILIVNPDSAQDRMLRAVGRFETGNRAGSLADADWLLEHHPEGIDMDRVLELRQMLAKPER